MRARISNVSRAIVASTNPMLNEKICSIDGKKNNLSKPVMVGERRGLRSRAVLDCTVVDMDGKNIVSSGTFESITNKSRINDRLIGKMCQKIS